MFILASSSLTRKSLLKNAGLTFSSSAPLVDETALHQKYAEQLPIPLTLKLASEKASSISSQYPKKIVVGVDQILHLENQVYHKPETINQAREMLLKLRGKTHHLTTAISCFENNEEIWSFYDQAKMSMRDFSDSFLEHYLLTDGNKSLASAGAYQLEAAGLQLFEKIEGDYFTILGFPLIEFLKFLRNRAVIES